jgi:hypothetical protein
VALYRVIAERSKTGRQYYVEDHEVPDWAYETKPEEGDYTYVVTRSEYPTSLFCQVESIGWIDSGIIEPLNPKLKKDRQIIHRIRSAERQGIERSQIWFDMMKAKERGHEAAETA